MAANQMGEVIRLVKSEAERLGEFLAELNDGDWAKDSYCEGWLIGDVAGHLAGGAESWVDSIGRAVNGDSNPPEGQVFLAPGDRASGVTADAARTAFQQHGAPGLLERFRTGYARLAETLDGLQPEDWDKPCFHRRGPMPLGAYVEVRLQELTVPRLGYALGRRPGGRDVARRPGRNGGPGPPLGQQRLPPRAGPPRPRPLPLPRLRPGPGA